MEQGNKEERKEEKKVYNTGIDYKNSKYRPSVFFDMKYKEKIEKHFKEKGYNSFNQYVNDIVLRDCGIEKIEK